MAPLHSFLLLILSLVDRSTEFLALKRDTVSSRCGKFSEALPRPQPEIMAHLFIKHGRHERVTHFWSNGSDRLASRRTEHYLSAAFCTGGTKTRQLGFALSPVSSSPSPPYVPSASERPDKPHHGRIGPTDNPRCVLCPTTRIHRRSGYRSQPIFRR